jgi:hypothetical protein
VLAYWQKNGDGAGGDGAATARRPYGDGLHHD